MELLQRTCHFEQMNIERIVARGFLIFGGLFWVTMVFGAGYGYRNETVLASTTSALLPLALTIVVFLIGWFYEMVAAIVLFAVAAGLTIFGIFMGWELGVWMTMIAFLIAPLVVSGLLFLLAARMQKVCELQEASEKS